ncbi:apolipoprotein N-acyltransferase [Georgenia sp. Z1491]|uniref:apolipoprotein N-acyltransferase n=1 Tax=Georgenia sp. Z1491 TaxID=3416707 RepID=UPI003CF6628A
MPATLPRPIALVLAVAAGLAADLAFAPRTWWWLAILAVGALHLALRGHSARFAYLVAAGFGLAFMLRHLSWAVQAVGGGEWLPWVALSILEALILALYGPLRAWAVTALGASRRPLIGALLAALAWVGVEVVRSNVPFGGLPWGVLAHSQVDGPLVSLARLGGEPLVSALVVLTGVLLAEGVSATSRLRPFRGVRLVATGGVVLLVGLILPLPTGAQSGTLSVGAVQVHVPGGGLTTSAEARQVTADHADLTEELVSGEPDLDLVLWAESAADVDPRTDEDVAASVERAAQAAGVPVLLGTQRYVDDGDGGRNRYNELVVWEAGQGPVGQAYAKQHPVPFGEYMPYRNFFRFFSPAVDRVTTDMLPGDRPGLVEVGVERLGRQVPLAVGICFEVGYEAIIAEGVALGGEMIVIPTNNATHGDTAVSAHQLAMTRFRAVEFGRSAVQVGRTGVSGVVAPDGELLERTDLFEVTTYTGEDLPLRTEITPAVRVARPAGLVAVLVTAGLGVAGIVRGRLTAPARSR